MNKGTIDRGNVRFAVAAFALVAFYGSLASFIARLGRAENATAIGGFVALGTAGLCAIVGAYAAVYLMPRDGGKRRSIVSVDIFFIPFLIAIAILAAPFIIMTGGWVWRWLKGKTEEEKPQP